MINIKKYIFIIPFILSFIAYCLYLNPFLQDAYLFLSFASAVFIQLIFTTAFALLASIFFVFFTLFSQEWKVFIGTMPAIILSSYLLIPSDTRIIFSISTGLLFVGLYAFLLKKIKTYTVSDPKNILAPIIMSSLSLTIIVSSVAFYFSAQQVIQKQGFVIPKSITGQLVNFLPNNQEMPLSQEIPLNELKKNSQALNQLGIDPKVLDQLPNTLRPNKLAQLSLENQLQNFIKPYQSFIPAILAVLFFFTLKSFAAILGIFLTPIVSLLFWILDSLKLTTYTTETRVVKKLVV